MPPNAKPPSQASSDNIKASPDKSKSDGQQQAQARRDRGSRLERDAVLRGSRGLWGNQSGR